MRLTRSLPFLAIPLLAFAGIYLISPANAGFQWIPPDSSAPPETDMDTAPPISTTPDVLVPMVIQPLGTNPPPAYAPPSPLSASPFSAPVYSAPAYTPPAYTAPQYIPPAAPVYVPPTYTAPSWTPPQAPVYVPPAYTAPQPQYMPPAEAYIPPAPQYAPSYVPPQRNYELPAERSYEAYIPENYPRPAPRPLSAEPAPSPIKRMSEDTYVSPEESPTYSRRAGDAPFVSSYEDNRPDAKKDTTAFTNTFDSKDDSGETSPVFKWLQRDETDRESAWSQGSLEASPVYRAPVIAPPAYVPAPSDYNIVEGFGSDLPLALALSQIVPPQYSYSFGGGVNPGERVSWNGGKPWNQVVSDMLAPLNIRASVSGKTVFLSKGSTSSGVTSSVNPSWETPSEDTSLTAVKRKNIRDPGVEPVSDDSILKSIAPVDEDQFSAKADASTDNNLKVADLPPATSNPALKDFSEASAPAQENLNVEAKTDTTIETKDLTKPPAMVAMPDTPAPDNKDLNAEAESLAYVPKNTSQQRFTEKVQRQIDEENIEMRMSATGEDVIKTEEPYRAGQSYDLMPNQPLNVPAEEFPSAQDMERKELKMPPGMEQNVIPPPQSAPQKMALLNEQTKTGNKFSPSEIKLWEAQKGDSLKETLVTWSRDANINLVWNAKTDYTVSSNVLVNGTFKSAIKSMFSEGLRNQNMPAFKFVDDPNSNEPTTFIVGDSV